MSGAHSAGRPLMKSTRLVFFTAALPVDTRPSALKVGSSGAGGGGGGAAWPEGSQVSDAAANGATFFDTAAP